MGILATVTDKGQVTVPKALRDQLGIAPGSRLEFEIEADGTLRVRPLTRGGAGLFGLLHDPQRPPSMIDQMNESIAGHVADDDARIARRERRR
jgi:antitoxin PrlF